MGTLAEKNEIILQLQKEILSMQGGRLRPEKEDFSTGLGLIEKSFADGKFPTGVIHEFISHAKEDATATNGFVAGLLGRLMQDGGSCLWVSSNRTLFPPTLKLFGVEPERVIFIDVTQEREALWVIEEALKCEALATVVGEIRELDFTQSRRLQLAVEESRCTGLIHRYYPKSENTVACVTRWNIRPLPSIAEDGMPGIGLPRWQVDLLKVRSGTPGSWQVEWTAAGFRLINKGTAVTTNPVQIHNTAFYA